MVKFGKVLDMLWCITKNSFVRYSTCDTIIQRRVQYLQPPLFPLSDVEVQEPLSIPGCREEGAGGRTRNNRTEQQEQRCVEKKEQVQKQEVGIHRCINLQSTQSSIASRSTRSSMKTTGNMSPNLSGALNGARHTSF